MTGVLLKKKKVANIQSQTCAWSLLPTAGPKRLLSFVPLFEVWGTDVQRAASHDMLTNPH